MLRALMGWAADHPVTVGMACLALGVLAFFDAAQASIELVPDLTYPRVDVILAWPGAAPTGLEAAMTSRVEAAASRLPGVRSVTSRTERGQAVVQVFFEPDARLHVGRLALRDALRTVERDWPVGARAPRVVPYVPPELRQEAFLTVFLTGALSPEALRRVVRDELQQRLVAVEGVARVTMLGGRRELLTIELDPDALRRFGLERATVMDLVLDALRPRHAGFADISERRLEVVVDAGVYTLDSLRALTLPGLGGRVRLDDVAAVRRRSAPPEREYRFQGQPRVALVLERAAGANVLELSDRVRALIEARVAALPGDLRSFVTHDGADQVRTELASLGRRLVWILAFVCAALLVVFRNLRTPALLLLTAGATAALTLSFMTRAGLSINVLTLAAMALGLGMLVDNAVVIVESVATKLKRGQPTRRAVVDGAAEVARPLFFAQLTTVGVFLPFIYFEGRLGVTFVPLALVLTALLAASVIVSWFLVPAAGARWLPAVDARHADAGRPGRLHRPVALVVRFWWVSPLLAAGLCVHGGWRFWQEVPRGRFLEPPVEERLVVSVSTPSGTDSVRTDQVIRSFENALLNGPSAEDVGEVWVQVEDQSARLEVRFSAEQLARGAPLAARRRLVEQTRGLARVSVSITGFGDPVRVGRRGFPETHNSRLQVRGYNLARAVELADAVGRQAALSPRVVEYRVTTSTRGHTWMGSFDLSERELALSLHPAGIRRFAADSQDVLDFVSLATARGTPRTHRYEGRERLPEVTEFTIRGAERQDVDSLMRLTAPAGYGVPARIENLAAVQEQNVPDGIDRRNQEYTVTASWDYQGPPRLADEYERQVHDAIRPPPGFSVHRDDEYLVTEDESRMLAFALAGAVLVMFLVLAVLYESLWHPFIVLATIPLALVGVCYVYLWTGASFTSSAYIGVILLVGIVDNNGVLLLDRISQLHRSGLTAREAATQGTLDRVRPVLLTSATTALGLLPMLWNEPGDGQPGLWSDLARSGLGGLVTSSLLVLAVVPSLYIGGEYLRRAARHVTGQLPAG